MSDMHHLVTEAYYCLLRCLHHSLLGRNPAFTRSLMRSEMETAGCLMVTSDQAELAETIVALRKKLDAVKGETVSTLRIDNVAFICREESVPSTIWDQWPFLDKMLHGAKVTEATKADDYSPNQSLDLSDCYRLPC